jgi:hypothetical protein
MREAIFAFLLIQFAWMNDPIATLDTKQTEVEKIVKSFGYNRIKSTGEDAHRWKVFEDWEKHQFDLKAKRVIKIKSRSPIKAHSKYYYRFAIWIEIYSDEKKAEKRTERLRDVPPHASAEYTEYFMADGFSDGNIVYIVETDGVMFLDELGSFTKRLKTNVEEQ